MAGDVWYNVHNMTPLLFSFRFVSHGLSHILFCISSLFALFVFLFLSIRFRRLFCYFLIHVYDHALQHIHYRIL
jgi:hypothetical protein